jgi:hypothetical protein
MRRQPQLYDKNVGSTTCECPATAGLFRLSEFNLGRRWGWLKRRAVLGKDSHRPQLSKSA